MALQAVFCLSDMVCCGKYQSVLWFNFQYSTVCWCWHYK